MAALAAISAGCSSPAEPAPPAAPQGAQSSQATPTVDPTDQGNPPAAAVTELLAGRSADLTTSTLPAPPPGFDAAEVAAFSERAIDIVTRGISDGLSDISPTAAFDYVFAGQYPETTQATRQAFEAVGDYDYSWAVAPRFEQSPTRPAKVLASRWQVTTPPGRTSDGAEVDLLQVALSVAVEHDLPASSATDAATVPVVMQRTIIVRGLKPLGGRTWWPAIGIQANPYFGGKCALVNGGILTPATRPETIAEDLNDLRGYLTKPKTIRGATSTRGDLDRYVEEYCEQ